MWRAAGVRRNGPQLADAAQTIRRWCGYVLSRQLPDPEGWELQNMLTVASLMVEAATGARGIARRALADRFPANATTHIGGGICDRANVSRSRRDERDVFARKIMAFCVEPRLARAGVSGYRHPPGQAVTLLPARGRRGGCRRLHFGLSAPVRCLAFADAKSHLRPRPVATDRPIVATASRFHRPDRFHSGAKNHEHKRQPIAPPPRAKDTRPPQRGGDGRTAMIEADNLSKFYGDFAASRDVTFTINRGEVAAFLGPNGAGKSTTMKLLTGYLAPSAGTARIAGYNMSTDRLEGAKHLGYLPENGPLYPDMTPRSLLTVLRQGPRHVARADRGAVGQGHRPVQAGHA